MKRLLYILMLLPVLGFGQHDVMLFSKGKVVVFNNNQVITNSLNIGLILKLRASNIYEDSLTFNSTAQYVTVIDGVNVTIDGTDDIEIGNSVRFGSPTSGTIYHITDTGASSAVLVLDQSFTGSVTDEFYWGGIGKWYDESHKLFNATQTTAIYQPKLLWYGTDSVRANFDGINDYMDINSSINDYLNVDSTFSIYTQAKTNSFSNKIILGSSVNSTNRMSIGAVPSGFGFNLYNGSANSKGITNSTTEVFKMIGTNEAVSPEFYFNGTQYSETKNTTVGSGIGVTKLGDASYTSVVSPWDGDIYDIYIYNRILDTNEINALSE